MAGRLLWVLLSILALATGTSAATVVYDIDGNPFNYPDCMLIYPFALVAVDVWILGPPVGCWAYRTDMCNPQHGLMYYSCTYNLPGGGWGGITPVPSDSNSCVAVQGENLAGDVLMVFPWRVATVNWIPVVDWTTQTLVSGDGSGIAYPDAGDWVPFLDNGEPLLTIHVGVDATEATSWGSIKSMFR